VPRFGRPNATGRSSGIRSGRQGRAHRPPEGEPWVWLTRDLLASPAWRARSVNTARLLDFLMIEHMNHGGNENGNLVATHTQLREYGLNANAIREAVEEAAFLGLIRFERGGRWAGSNQPSRYRLTFLAGHDDNKPTNEWKRVTDQQIEQWFEGRRKIRRGKRKRKADHKFGTTVPLNSRVPMGLTDR
jgi:hypothetical protein